MSQEDCGQLSVYNPQNRSENGMVSQSFPLLPPALPPTPHVGHFPVLSEMRTLTFTQWPKSEKTSIFMGNWTGNASSGSRIEGLIWGHPLGLLGRGF